MSEQTFIDKPVAAPPTSTTSAVQRTRRRRERRTWWHGPLVIVIVGLLWEAAARLFPGPFFPPLSRVFERMGAEWFSGEPATLFMSRVFADMLGASLGRLIPSFIVGALIGLIAGVLIGMLPRFRALSYPLINFLRSIPPIALLPLFIVLLGLGDESKVTLITVSVVWPVLINVMDGVRSAEPLINETLRSYGGRTRHRLWWIAIPTSAPHFFAGLRISTMVALAVLTVTEMYAGGSGVGYQILFAQRQFDIVGMWAGVIVLAVIGLAMSLVLTLIERRALRWHAGARRQSR